MRPCPPSHRLRGVAPLAAAALLLIALERRAAAEPPPLYKPPDGSLTPPVHLIPLYDEHGDMIVPGETGVDAPFSTRQTCGRCHDYDAIAQGWHFNAPDRLTHSGRAGEPWVLVDERTGTQLAVSNRGWSGAWSPAAVGLTPWDFTKRFARHSPGGGEGEYLLSPPEANSRWDISGYAEINCLACHNASHRQDQSEYVLQVSRENYKWAPTAASGLGIVDGVASRLPNSYNEIDGPDPDNIYIAPPDVRYDLTRFDAKHRVFFDLTRDIPEERCYFCHSTAHEAAESKPAWRPEGDVHLAAGLSCVDCHRNGLDHMIARGYGTEASERGRGELASLSCEGCHYGPGGASGKFEPVAGFAAGRLGAPRPAHKGLPPIHFEKMACTACHSGPLPEMRSLRARTSRANRLGVHGKAYWDFDLPLIATPVFAPQMQDSRLAPHNAFWPAFWALAARGELRPLLPEAVAEAAGDALAPHRLLAKPLLALQTVEDAPGYPVAIYKGKAYSPIDAEHVERLNLEAGAPGDDLEPVWRWKTEEGFAPLLVDAFSWTAEALLDPAAQLSDLQIEKILGGLAYDNAAQGKPVYLRNGLMFQMQDPPAEAFGELPKLVHAAAPREAERDGAPYWGDLNDGQTTPLATDVVKASVEAMVPFEQDQTRTQIQAILTALQSCGYEDPVYLTAGKLFGLTPMDEESLQMLLDEKDAPEGQAKDAPVWRQRIGDALEPLAPVFAAEAIDRLYDNRKSLTADQVRMTLAALAAAYTADKGEPVYISAGLLRRLDSGGELIEESHPLAKPYLWPIGHDVRPAAQSLGAGGCSDCHSESAPMLFGQVAVEGPLDSGKPALASMASFMQLDEKYERLFSRSFVLRPALKWGGFALSALVGAIGLLYFLLALRRFFDLDSALGRCLLCRLFYAGLFVCAAVLAVSGFRSMFVTRQYMSGMWLMTHVAFGGAFIGFLALVALTRSERHRFGRRDGSATRYQKILYWAGIVFGLAATLTILLSMTPLFGHDGQAFLYQAHRWSALPLAAAILLGSIAWRPPQGDA